MKRGFTLIELLAVIVILAIIAVIAVPIVLNIIDESKDNAGLRSAEMYIKAAELSIAQATLKNKNIEDKTYHLINGNICLATFDNGKCKGINNRENHEEDMLEVEVNGKVPTTGEITITNGNITGINIELDGKEIYKNSKGELVYVKFLDEVCELKSGTPKTAGAKYECKVDPNKDAYTFYVLTTPSSTDESINLIMDQNINSDGIPAGMTGTTKNGDNAYNLVAWNSSGSSTGGPVDAMQFLQEATKNWTNTNEMTINTYTDETGTPLKEMETYNTYARMPIYLSDATKTEVADKTDANAYLYDNLDPDGNAAPFGYWTLSSHADAPYYAWSLYYFGHVFECGLGSDGFGVRAVINLKI